VYHLSGIFLNRERLTNVIEACEFNHYVIKLQIDEWGRYIPDAKGGFKKLKQYGHVEIVMLYDYSENDKTIKLRQEKFIERKTLYVTRTVYLADQLNRAFKHSGCEARAAAFDSCMTGTLYQRIIWTFSFKGFNDSILGVSGTQRAIQRRKEYWPTHLSLGNTIEDRDYDEIYAEHYAKGFSK
jgi:hypothetical protein